MANLEDPGNEKERCLFCKRRQQVTERFQVLQENDRLAYIMKRVALEERIATLTAEIAAWERRPIRGPVRVLEPPTRPIRRLVHRVLRAERFEPEVPKTNGVVPPLPPPLPPPPPPPPQPVEMLAAPIVAVVEPETTESDVKLPRWLRWLHYGKTAALQPRAEKQPRAKKRHKKRHHKQQAPSTVAVPTADWLTTQQVMKVLDISAPQSVDYRRKKGHLVAKHEGHRWFYDRASVLALQEKQRAVNSNSAEGQQPS